MTPIRHTGEVRFFSLDRGWGFITPDKEILPGRDVFVHRSALVDAHLTRLDVGQRVSFEMGQHDGRPLATKLQIIDGKE